MEWVVGMTVPGAVERPRPEERVREGWFLGYTNERSEGRVAEALKRRGIETRLITERVRRRVRGRMTSDDVALFPRYVFVELAADDFMRLRGTPGLEALVRNGEGFPARIPDSVVDGLHGREQRGDFDHTRKATVLTVPPRGHREGDRVEVIAGPWRSFIGTVERLLPSERIELLISMFGRPCSVAMSLADVERPC